LDVRRQIRDLFSTDPPRMDRHLDYYWIPEPTRLHVAVDRCRAAHVEFRRQLPGRTAPHNARDRIDPIPLWWYFEAINGPTANWQYMGRDRYDDFDYAVFASISFATVVPALAAATAMIGRFTNGLSERVSSPDRRYGFSGFAILLIGSGIVCKAATLMAPSIFYPLVWISPFLLFDGLVIAAGGHSLVMELSKGIWRRAAVIAGAGLLCGGLWEFWNFWAFPKWTYDIPLLDFVPVFELPILGYGGYIPFAWSVVQLVALVDIAAGKFHHRMLPL